MAFALNFIIYISNYENNVSFQLSQQWLCGKPWTWADDVPLHITGTSEPRLLNKQKKEYNISSHKGFTTHRVPVFCRNKMD